MKRKIIIIKIIALAVICIATYVIITLDVNEVIKLPVICGMPTMECGILPPVLMGTCITSELMLIRELDIFCNYY